jgi:predicted dehydrogenase
MKNQKVRWGVLGCSSTAIGKVIPAVQSSANVEVIAISSRNMEKAKENARVLGIKSAYGSYEELLADPDVDAVYIPLPNSLHCDWTVRAAKTGKQVLCEKPAAMSPEECEQMMKACQKNQVFFMEGFMYRFHPQHQRVKEIIGSGVIGTVKLMRASFSFPMAARHSKIRLSKELGGGALMDVGCYCINACRFILDAEPIRVFASAEMSPDGQVDTLLVATLEFPENVKGVIDCGLTMTRRHAYEVVGTEGKIDVPAAFVPTEETSITITKEGMKQEERFEAINQYRLEFEHFSECIIQRRSPRFLLQDALSNSKVIVALRRSMNDGKPVSL